MARLKTPRPAYVANVTRDGKFWLIRIPKVGVTQARRLGETEAMARDLIATMLEVSATSFDITIDVQLPAKVRSSLTKAETLRVRSAEAQAAAAAEIRIAAKLLHETEGIPLRDVGEVLGVSYQRAHQLVS